MEEAAAHRVKKEESEQQHDQSSMEEEEQHDEEEEWQEYLRSQRSRKTFAQYYRCRPMALLGMDDYDDGNRVVMPQSALERLSSVKVEYRMVFRIQNAATLSASHVGVQEFVADEGFVHVPTHTMARLGLLLHGGHEDDDGQLVLLTSTSLPKATSVKLQPHTSDFLKVKYPKELLEYNFGKYRCMTVGDTITVVEGDRRYLLDVVEAKPADAVSTVETDCEVDFLPPLDYKEPTAPPVRVPSALKTNNAGEDEGRFAGPGVRMDGKTVAQAQQMPPPTLVKKIATPGPGHGEEGRFAGVGVRMDGQSVQWQSSAVVAFGPGEQQRSISFRPPPQMAPSAGPSANNRNALRFGAGASVPAAGNAGKKADDGEPKEAKWNGRRRVFVKSCSTQFWRNYNF